MHGDVLCGLRRFLLEEYGEDVWETVLTEADVERQLFLPVTDYPPGYYYELVRIAAEYTGRHRNELERAFGRSLVDQRLGDTCGPVDDDGTGRSRLERIDELVTTWFDTEGVETTALSLDAERIEDNRFRLTYGSPEGLCEVVRGIVDGLEADSEADWSVSREGCMHDGAMECTFVVTTSPSGRPPRRPVGRGHGR